MKNPETSIFPFELSPKAPSRFTAAQEGGKNGKKGRLWLSMLYYTWERETRGKKEENQKYINAIPVVRLLVTLASLLILPACGQ